MSKNIQIALVSKETLPVFYIINEFRPDEVFLVGTEETTLEMDQIERSAAKMGTRSEEHTSELQSQR